MSVDSPNLDNLDAWAHEVRKVEKPWGYELIWALTDVYCGKVLFVKAGQSLSLQFHREKDESWLDPVRPGQARARRGGGGRAEGGGRSGRAPPSTTRRAPSIA